MTEDTTDFLFSACVRFPLDSQYNNNNNNNNNKISKLGPRSNPCPRSYIDPTGPTGSMRNSKLDGDATTNTPIVVNYGKPMSSQNSAIASDHTLSHPVWTDKISRIPRSARASCRSPLKDIISRIVASSNSKSDWNELLLYAPAILSKTQTTMCQEKY